MIVKLWLSLLFLNKKRGVLKMLVNPNFTNDDIIFESEIDSSLSSSSKRPVENKVITEALKGKSNVGHSHLIKEVTDFPTYLEPLFKQDTWYPVGEDSYIGSHGVSGGLGLLGNNGTTRLDFCKQDEPDVYKSITFDGTVLNVDGNCEYAKAAGNANTVGGLSPYHVATLDESGNSQGNNLQFYCKFNKFGDNRYGLGINSATDYQIRVDYASNAASLSGITSGSEIKPVYFSNGKPVATTYTLGKSVPSDAKFTDTVYTHPTTSGNKHIPAGGSSGQILRWSADGTAAWGNDNNTTYSPATTSANGLMSSSDKAKLDGIATGANKTVVDSALSSTSTNPVQNKVVYEALSDKLNVTLKGANSGLAELDSDGKVPLSQLPSSVTNVIEGFYNNSKFYQDDSFTTEITGESGKIYVDLSTNKTYRWNGSIFTVISETIFLGETSSTAYRGDRGKIAYDHSQSSHARIDATKVEKSSVNGNVKINGTEVNVYTHPSGTNPHGTTKADVGLGNVDNTSDMDKPVSTAVQSAISTHEGNTTLHITSAERTKWNAAEQNVQSDWSVSDTTSDAFIKNKPTSLPASDVSAWAKAATKPTYTASEVGADPAGSANTALENAKKYTDSEIAGIINGAPTTLDTLGEIADAMAENKNVVDALNEAIGTKATSTDLTSHTTNKSNPHGVTKSQVGLGNVPNVATNDQTPTFTESSSLTKLTSGEKLSVAFGKISKAVTDFISHNGDSVKHITSTERTNWNAAKTHADSAHAPSNAQANVIETVKVNGTALTPSSKAVNITVPTNNNQLTNGAGYITSSGTAKTISDTLPISKGGTGKTTGEDAANALINSLSTGGSTPTDADYYISQYVGGGTNTTTYHRRPMSALWSYIQSKLATVATSGSYNDLSNKPELNKQLASEDLNDIKTVGFYYGGGSNSVKNKPSGVDAFGLEVIQSANGWYTQIMYASNNVQKSYRRWYNGGGWTSWIEDKFTDTVYTHPTTSGNKHIPSGGSSGQILRWSADGTAVWGNDNNTTYNDATTSTHGLMSVSDKKALDVLKTPYATCATGRATADKVATLANFTLSVGATVVVKFTDTAGTTDPTSGNLTLNVNNTGAKPIACTRYGVRYNIRYDKGSCFYNNITHIFTYDGIYWLCMDWNHTDVATTYGVATTSANGLMSSSDKAKLDGIATGANKTTVDSALSSTSTNPVQNKVVYSALASKAASSHTHSYAGSSSAGGSATSAVKLDTASAGSASQPVYFSGGKPVPCTTLGLNDYVVGTQTTSTNAFTGNLAGVSALYDGLSIRYYLPYAGTSSSATLKLTLTDSGTTTAAIPVYRNSSSTFTNQCGAGSILYLTYKSSVNRWVMSAQYDADTYDRIRHNAYIKCNASTAIATGDLIVAKDGLYYPLKSGTAFDITQPILYSGVNIAVNATQTWTYIAISANATVTQSITLTTYKPVYIKGKLSGTLFTPISTTPLTQTIPTSDDGYQYILLGSAYSTTHFYLLPHHPIFEYKNGSFGLIGRDAKTVNGHTVNSDVPANAKFTDTNTWRGIQNNLTSDSTTDSLSAAQGKVLKGLVDGKAASSHTHTKSQITDFPSSLPANGGTADTARQVTSPSSKVRLWEDGEGGNLELVAPDGVHLMQMDIFNNSKFRMYFYDGSTLFFPFNFDFSNQRLDIEGNVSLTSGSIITPANDSMGIIPAADNYGQIGSSDKKFFRMYATTFYGSLSGNATTATSAGNADTVDNVHAYNMATLNAGGGSHGTSYLMYCQHNVLGDNRFYIGVGGGYERSVAVGFAEASKIAYDASHATLASSSVESDKVRTVLIGTTSANYTTILAWANANSGLSSASIVSGNGIPSDAPLSDEAMLRLESDYYGARKIVTWTRYMEGDPVIFQRAIFNGSWLDSEWRRVK